MKILKFTLNTYSEGSHLPAESKSWGSSYGVLSPLTMPVIIERIAIATAMVILKAVKLEGWVRPSLYYFPDKYNESIDHFSYPNG